MLWSFMARPVNRLPDGDHGLECREAIRVQAAVCMIFSENRFAVFRIVPWETQLLDRAYFFILETDVKPLKVLNLRNDAT